MKTIRNEAVKIFMALMFTLLPLYYTDNYYYILDDKFIIFDIFSKILIGVICGTLIISLICDIYKKKLGIEIKAELLKKNSLDMVMLLFLVATIFSLIHTLDFETAFDGSAAWLVGGYALIIGVVLYFIISRFYSGKPDVWVYLLFGSLAVIIIGILDRFGNDFLVMHDEIPLSWNIFISTIGNVNFWGAFLSVIVPFFMMMPIFTKSRGYRFFIYLFLGVAYFSLFVVFTNTSYFGIGIALLFIVWYSLKDIKRLSNLAVEGIMFSFAGAIAEFLWKNPDTFARPMDTDTVSLVLLSHKLYLLPGIVGVLLIFFVLILDRLKEGTKEKITNFVEKILPKIWLGLIGVGVVAVIYYIVKNFSLEMFTYRGSIWYFSFQGFLDGDFFDKLIGVGPGMLDSVTRPEIENASFHVVWDYYYNTAHNDVLEYLVTMGVIGAALRVVMFIIPFVMFKKNKTNEAQKAAVLAALVGYMGQGFVTGPYIYVYVFYIIFLGAFSAYDRMEQIS
ncbi:MAG: O-antigen ligase family protein [Lachnospiraceae bacterium]|nr:O-antigen ligase family protein [Lachnospiraceae bacterium]